MTDAAKSHHLPWPIGSAQYRRIRQLASRMLADFPRVRRTDDTSDVAHSAMIRLSGSLQKVQPQSELHFWRMVAVAIRRTLLDLARQARPMLPFDDVQARKVGSNRSVAHQANWAEFHERAAQIPESQRDVLNLHWYAGLSQEQVADLLNVDVRTVQRRWRNARMSLYNLIKECIPTSALLNKPRNGQQRDESE